jgi:hypothetical protein
MSSTHPRDMNRLRTNHGRYESRKETQIPQNAAGGGSTSQCFGPPLTQFHRRARRQPYSAAGLRGTRGESMSTHQKPKLPLTWENVPEVGLELHSSPCNHWEPLETCGIRPDPTPIRPSPTLKVWTLSTPPIRRFKGFQTNDRTPQRSGRSFLPLHQSKAPPGPERAAGGHVRRQDPLRTNPGRHPISPRRLAPPFDNPMIRSAETHLTDKKRPRMLASPNEPADPRTAPSNANVTIR